MRNDFIFARTSRYFQGSNFALVHRANASEKYIADNRAPFIVPTISISDVISPEGNGFRVDGPRFATGFAWIEGRAMGAAFLHHFHDLKDPAKWRIIDEFSETIVKAERIGSGIKTYVKTATLEKKLGEEVDEILNLSAFGLDDSFCNKDLITLQFMNGRDKTIVIPVKKDSLTQEMNVDGLVSLEYDVHNEYIILVDTYSKNIASFDCGGNIVGVDDRVRLCLHDFLLLSEDCLHGNDEFYDVGDLEKSLSIEILEAEGSRWIVNTINVIGEGHFL